MSNIAVELIEQGKAHDYYYTTEWVHRQKETMDRYKRECIRCRWLAGTAERAYILHHVKRLKAAPEYADVEFVEPTKEDLLAVNKAEYTVKQYYNGNFYDIVCLGDKMQERYYIKGINKVIQLLPLCRNCHKIVHRRLNNIVPPKPGTKDELFEELL